jgi:hypothetical protein
MLPAWNPGAACHAYCASTTPTTSQAFFPSGKAHQARTGSGGLVFLLSKDTPGGSVEAGPPPWRQPRGKSEANVPQMLHPGGSN